MALKARIELATAFLKGRCATCCATQEVITSRAVLLIYCSDSDLSSFAWWVWQQFHLFYVNDYFLIQGWDNISGMVIRLFGSTVHIDRISPVRLCERGFLPSWGWCVGNLIWPVYITAFNSRMFDALNGTVPHTIAYSSTPKPHMSD